MKTMTRSLLLASLFVGGTFVAFAQPVIDPGGIVNNSSFVVAGLPGAGLAPSSIFTMFGSNMGPTALTAYSGLPAQVPTTLGGVTVNFTSGGTTLPAPLYYVSAGQIAGIVPYNLPPSATATATVTYNGATSAAVSVVIAASSFGVATLNGSGSGPAAIEDFTNNYAIIKASAPAKPGDTGIIYGTGLGSNPAGDQPLSSTGTAAGYGTNLQSTYNAIVYVGGVQASVGYAGASAFPGLSQINFTIPSNAPTGCFVPVIVQIGSIVSNSPTIAISSTGSTCSDPMGLTPTQITQAESSGLTVGSLLLTRLSLETPLLPSTPITEDSAEAHFYDFTGNGSSSPDFNRSFVSLSAFGSCQITYCGGTYTCVPSAQALTIPGIDAGTLTVSGSSAMAPSTPLTETSTGNYSVGLAAYPLPLKGFVNNSQYLQPGSFTFAGSGSSSGGAGAFSTSITVPNVLTWSSPGLSAGSTVSRSSPLSFTWTPTGNAGDYVLLSVSSATDVGTSSSTTYNSATVLCLQQASAGSYTMPSWILQALPASSMVNVGLTIPSGAVLAGVFNVTKTTTIPNVDVALANSLVTSGVSVTIQ